MMTFEEFENELNLWRYDNNGSGYVSWASMAYKIMTDSFKEESKSARQANAEYVEGQLKLLKAENETLQKIAYENPNLREQIEELKAELKTEQDKVVNLISEKSYIDLALDYKKKENEELKQRIEKAKQYLKPFSDGEILDYPNPLELLEILEGNAPSGSKCTAIIWHGNGHQSKGNCDVKGKHTQHHCEGPRTNYYWSSNEAFSGAFDESPEEENEQ